MQANAIPHLPKESNGLYASKGLDCKSFLVKYGMLLLISIYGFPEKSGIDSSERVVDDCVSCGSTVFSV